MRLTRYSQLIEMATSAKASAACVSWPFGKSMGYPIVFRGGTPVRGHTVVCEAFYGPKPVGKQEAAHSCGNRLCVNPRHLRWASWEENSADKFKQGRQPIGLANHAAKLSDDEVRAIRASPDHAREVAAAFGLHKRYVYKLRSKDRRSYVGD